jgi:hypothetical protein
MCFDVDEVIIKNFEVFIGLSSCFSSYVGTVSSLNLLLVMAPASAPASENSGVRHARLQEGNEGKGGGTGLQREEKYEGSKGRAGGAEREARSGKEGSKCRGARQGRQ